MKKFLVALVPMLLSSVAIAAPTPSMTCGQARAIVANRGGVVLYTGQHTYDRYVADRSFCEPSQITKPAWVPTRDAAQCYVGGTCIDPDSDRDTWMAR